MTKKEVIQHIKDWDLDNDKIEVLSVIIPELKESEDEKIRKQLLNWFKDCNWDAIDNGTLKREDIIDWLEKQGEQKSEEVDNLHNYLYSEQKSVWSEEDEERFVSCLQRLGTSNLEQPETINTIWLKSLKDRITNKDLKKL